MKHILLLFFIALCGAMLQGCSDNECIDENKKINFAVGTDEQLVIPVEGGTYDIKFTANATWTASVSAITRAADWISISPMRGESGDATISITTQPNESYDERNAAVTITCGDERKIITVTQKQKDALILSSNKVELDAEASYFTIELQRNVSVSYEIESAASEWLKPTDGTRALTETTLNFKAEENTDKESRQAVITLKGENLTEYVTVYQLGTAPFIVLTQQEYTVGSSGETIKVELKSNTRYELDMPDVSWIKEVGTRATSAYTHYFEVSPNDTYDARQAEISFTDKSNGLTEKVTIYQVQLDAIVIAKDRYDLTCKASELDFKVQTNVDLDVSVSASWIKRVEARTRGLVDMDLCFDVEANNDPDNSREATITIAGKNSNAKQTIKVYQNPYSKELVSVTHEIFKFYSKVGIVFYTGGGFGYTTSYTGTTDNYSGLPIDHFEPWYAYYMYKVYTYSDGSKEDELKQLGDAGIGAKPWQYYVYLVKDDYDDGMESPWSDGEGEITVENGKCTYTENAGSIHEVAGLDFHNYSTSIVSDSYSQSFPQDGHATSYIGDYEKYTPWSISFTDEQEEKLQTYFGKEDVMWSDINGLTVKDLISIMGSEDWDNPYLGLPKGRYGITDKHHMAVGLDGVTIGNDYKLGYLIEFFKFDSFVIDTGINDSPVMVTNPMGAQGEESYTADLKILSEDEDKTVGVLNLTFKQDFTPENSNRIPFEIDDDFYPTFTYETFISDTLACYKEKSDAPFKVDCRLEDGHYRVNYATYWPKGNILMEWNTDTFTIQNEQGIGYATRDMQELIDVTTDVDWISIEEGWWNVSADDSPYFESDILYNLTPNYETYPRVGYITIKKRDSGYKEIIRVVQRGERQTNIDNMTYEFDYTGGEFSVTGQSNVPDNLYLVWNVDWIEKVSKTRGMSDYSIGPLYVMENTSTESRTGYVYLREKIGNANSQVETIVVTQSGRPAAMSTEVKANQEVTLISPQKGMNKSVRKIRK